MGERDLTGANGPRAGVARRALVPAVLLLVLGVIGLMRPLEPPTSPRGVGYALGAASLARDFDLRFEAEDETRFRELVVMRPLAVLLAGDDEVVYSGEPLSMLYLAPFVRIAGLRGAWFAHSLALVLAMAIAARTLGQRSDTAWRVLAVSLFASVALLFVMEPRPEALALAAVVAAFGLAFRSEASRFEELGEVYDDRASRSGWRGRRWLLVGALLGLALAIHPIYLPLLLAAVLIAPAEQRGSAGGLVGLGAGLVVLLSLSIGWISGGAPPWSGPLGLYTATTGFPGLSPVSPGAPVPTVLETAGPVFDLRLLGWNLLFLIVGRTVGALPYFLPILLLLALWEPRTGRSTLVAVVAVTALLAVVVWPFDYAGDATGLGNALLLPVFGALWLIPTRRCPAWAAGLVLVGAGLLLWPTWLGTLGLGGAGSSLSPTPWGAVARWLPHETSRRPAGSDFERQEAMGVLPAGGGLSERNGRLLLTGGQWGSLVLASPRPLDTVYLSFDGQAGSELEVTGGELGDTLFGADGGVGFEVRLDGAARRHRMWWSGEPQSLYDLSLRLPRAPEVPVAFRVGATPGGN